MVTSYWESPLKLGLPSNMAALEEDDVLDEEHLNAVIQFPPDVQEAIDQVIDQDTFFQEILTSWVSAASFDGLAQSKSKFKTIINFLPLSSSLCTALHCAEKALRQQLELSTHSD